MSLGPESSPPEVKAAGCLGAALGAGVAALAGPLVALGVRKLENRLLDEPAGFDGVVATLVVLVGGALGAALGMRIGARQLPRPGPAASARSVGEAEKPKEPMP